MMRSKIQLAFSISILILNSLCSQSISGKIMSDESVGFAHIYLSGSIFGTYSNENGEFEINDVKQGTYELIVSHIGYELFKKSIEIDQDSIKLSIKLIPSQENLSEVVITTKKDSKWKKNYKQFVFFFFGKTPFGKQCEILNPWVLEFESYKGFITANAYAPLEIKNNALGYIIKYDLIGFSASDESYSYTGYSSFSEIDTLDRKVISKWKKNRRDAYAGSLSDFFSVLIQDKIEESRFKVYKDKEELEKERKPSSVGYDPIEQRKIISHRITAKSELLEKIGENKYRLFFRGEIQVSYSPISNANYFFFTKLKLKEDAILLNGNLINPLSLKVTGYFGERGFPYFLPIK